MLTRRSMTRKRTSPNKSNESEGQVIKKLTRSRSKRSINTEEKDKRILKKAKDAHDKYCWKCHRVCQETCHEECEGICPQFCEEACHQTCEKCNRTYHKKCLTKVTQFNKKDPCFHCQQLLISRKDILELIGDASLSEILLTVIQNAFPIEPKENHPLIEWPDSYKLCPVTPDYCYIHDRAKVAEHMQYQSHAELLDDVALMHHNCVVIYGENSTITKAAKKVVEQFKTEIDDMLDCPLCYSRKSTEGKAFMFQKPCVRRHPIIWAKVKFHSYWPAKSFRVAKGKAHVRFFFTYQIGHVPLHDCYFYSNDYPGKKPEKKSEKFLLALNELEAYLRIFKSMYGDYPVQPEKTQYNHEKAQEIMKSLDTNISQNNEDTNEDTNEDVKVFHVVEEREELGFIGLCSSSIENPNPDNQDFNTSSENEVEIQTSTRNGHLLPGVHGSGNRNFHEPRIPIISSVNSGISISNVTSGNEIPVNVNLNLSDNHIQSRSLLDNRFVDNFFPQNNTTLQVASSNLSENMNAITQIDYHLNNSPIFATISASSQVFSSVDEDSDIEIIEPDAVSNGCKPKPVCKEVKAFQRALKQDPNIAKTALNYASMMIVPFFNKIYPIIKNVGNNSQSLAVKDSIIKTLKAKNESLENQLKNADQAVQHFANYQQERKMLTNEIEKLKSELEEAENKNLKLKQLNEQDTEKLVGDIAEARKQDFWCSNCCYQQAVIFCCWNGTNTFKFCSKECRNASDHNCQLTTTHPSTGDVLNTGIPLQKSGSNEALVVSTTTVQEVQLTIQNNAHEETTESITMRETLIENTIRK